MIHLLSQLKEKIAIQLTLLISQGSLQVQLALKTHKIKNKMLFIKLSKYQIIKVDFSLQVLILNK